MHMEKTLNWLSSPDLETTCSEVLFGKANCGTHRPTKHWNIKNIFSSAGEECP